VRLQILSSGSGGNAALLRVGATTILVDAGLGPRELRARLAAAGVGAYGLHHVLVSHAHLDHARSAGKIARDFRAVLHAPESILRHRSCSLAKQMATMPVDGEFTLEVAGEAPLSVRTVQVPHDCDPTVGFRFEHRGRVLVHVTDLGEARDELVRTCRDPHVLVVESNHDVELLLRGPYSAELKRRVLGPRGHLSNDQAADLVGALIGPRLHTLVLAHLSEQNNTHEHALATARRGLARVGRTDVNVIVALQHELTREVAL
jgi:phosphoribosyl 1,2-cyclic phosphodiesterase